MGVSSVWWLLAVPPQAGPRRTKTSVQTPARQRPQQHRSRQPRSGDGPGARQPTETQSARTGHTAERHSAGKVMRYRQTRPWKQHVKWKESRQERPQTTQFHMGVSRTPKCVTEVHEGLLRAGRGGGGRLLCVVRGPGIKRQRSAHSSVH